MSLGGRPLGGFACVTDAAPAKEVDGDPWFPGPLANRQLILRAVGG